MNVLQVENFEKYYGYKSNLIKVIDCISFTVEKGEYIGIMGSSGSGKTTILNCISTIDTATAGHIYIEGKDITKMKPAEVLKFRRVNLGIIFQDYNLLDSLTAYENIALALTINKTPIKVIDNKIEKVSSMLNITHILKRYPHQLSGGEKQRVASARAVITEPSIILADEPSDALDSKSTRMLMEYFVKLNAKTKTTILMVTHDAFIASYCNRILFIKDGKIFNEVIRGKSTRKDFYNKIIDVVSLLGGDPNVD